MESVILLEVSIEIAITIMHSIAYHVQLGHDSFGMWMYGFAPMLVIKNGDYLIFQYPLNGQVRGAFPNE